MKQEPFLERLESSVLVCDGAMGTMLYARGIFINRCFDELNLSQPELILDIHREYAAARADILETNTFGANSFKLQPHGFENQVYDINRRGAELAREAAGELCYVAGAIGPLGLPLEPYGNVRASEAEEAFRTQAQGLADGGVDLFLLETFGDINEILLAIKSAQSVADLPLWTQMTFNEEGTTLLGAIPEKVVDILQRAGADGVGANCSVGPRPMLEVIERMAAAGCKRLSAQPNAGNPRIVDGRFLYLSSPEYHAEFARRYIAAGARIVGGCCGTTPAHIKAIANAVRAVQPRKAEVVIPIRPPEAPEITVIPREEKSALAAKFGQKFAISVEVISPRGIDPSKVLDGVRRLVACGVDAINIPDGPRASSRMSPMALAVLVERNQPVETILHYCCRDRNLLGMQSDLLGAYALGLRNVLIITGDPPKLGDYPDATAVFDVDSIGLARIVNAMNHGMDIAGNPLGQPTGWHLGVAVNPCAMDLDLELQRFEKKLKAGAEYVLTQPVFDAKQFEKFLQRIENIDIPLMVGIMILSSYRTVEFFNNEVPGVTVPKLIAEKMRRASTAEDASRTGIEIAQKMLLEVKSMDKVVGVYLMPPFGKKKYDSAIEVLQVLK